MILHHTQKQPKKGNPLVALRGSGDIGAFCDSVLIFSRLENEDECLFNVTMAKNRHIDLNELPGFTVKVTSR